MLAALEERLTKAMEGQQNSHRELAAARVSSEINTKKYRTSLSPDRGASVNLGSTFERAEDI